MSPFHLIRALVTIGVAVPLTFLVSALVLIDITFFRKSSVKAQIFPRLWGRIICRLAGANVNIEGLENISKDQTYIFVANHVSQFDIFCFQGYIPHDFRWIAKKELFQIPLFGPAMRSTGFISIDRSQGRKAMQSLNEAAEKIASGTSVLIFPEGTRSTDGTLQQFKSGAILIAIKAGVPVVPISFNGTYQILSKNRLLPRPGNVTIRIGKAIETRYYKPKDKQELAKQLQGKVAELLY
jgi:1-acyl-sn-glycerol-3-phosphate acyltransferase